MMKHRIPRWLGALRRAGLHALLAGILLAGAPAWAQDTNRPASRPAVPADTPSGDLSVWKARLDAAVEALAGLTGDWVQREMVAGIKWGQGLLAMIVIALAAVIVQGLRWVLRRWLRRQAGSAPDQAKSAGRRASWLGPTLEAAIPPLTLFVWTIAGYAALVLLLGHWQTAEPPSLVITAAGWFKDIGEIGALFWFLFRMIQVVDGRLKQWSSGTASKWDNVIVVLVVRALRMIVPLVGVILVVPALEISAASHILFKQAASLLLIGAVGFVAYQLVNSVEEAVLNQFRVDVKDNLEARKVNTQVKVLKKIAVVIIVIFAAASMLMVFDSVRQLGTSILASAGVLGIIVGFAAQRSIATVLAGLQIALTQPIRLDDVVIVEGEWGRIEEITLTYVVVRIWDLRRLIVPITYFIERSFQNWTRVSADLLGSVFLYVDYNVPLRALRDELDRLLEHNPRWDRKVKVIQVTDARERTLEVRVLLSAADASTAWDLRCEIREELIAFLQRHYPQSLPRTRAALVPAGDPPALPDAFTAAPAGAHPDGH